MVVRLLALAQPTACSVLGSGQSRGAVAVELLVGVGAVVAVLIGILVRRDRKPRTENFDGQLIERDAGLRLQRHRSEARAADAQAVLRRREDGHQR
jgi:hypothetical protein